MEKAMNLGKSGKQVVEVEQRDSYVEAHRVSPAPLFDIYGWFTTCQKPTKGIHAAWPDFDICL